MSGGRRRASGTFEIRRVVIQPGAERAFDDAEWRDAIVVVASGGLVLVGRAGSRRSFGRGAVLWLAGLSVCALRSPGPAPCVLLAVSRAGRAPRAPPPPREDGSPAGSPVPKRPRSMPGSTSVGVGGAGRGVPVRAAEQRGGVARWQRALLPHGVYEESGGGRSARDWLVDVTVFLVAVGVGVLVLLGVWDERPPLVNGLDVAVGSAACLALWVRRSRPVEVAVFAVAASAFFAMPGGASFFAIFNAAIRAPRRALVGIAALALVSAVVFPLVNPVPDPFLVEVVLGVLLTAVAIGWGLFVRVRRELIGSLRERAERLEAEQRRREEQAREAERRRIAHEMHDVLAHRLSLLSVHAGALEFRPDAPADEVAEAACVIRATANTALDELRTDAAAGSSSRSRAGGRSGSRHLPRPAAASG